jgi:hypothetical protein
MPDSVLFWFLKNRLIESPRVDLAVSGAVLRAQRGRFLERGAAAGPDIASAKRHVLPEIKNGRAGVWPFPPQPQAIANGLPLRKRRADRAGGHSRARQSSAAQKSVAFSHSVSSVLWTGAAWGCASAIRANTSAITLCLGYRCEEGTIVLSRCFCLSYDFITSNR